MAEAYATAPDFVTQTLANTRLRCVARVQDPGGATDFAVLVKDTGLIVIRCVPRASRSDCRAVETMMAEGDFRRGILVASHGRGVAAHPGLEICSLDQLPGLLARYLHDGAA